VLFSGNSLLKNPNVASQTPPGNLSWGQVPGETAVFLIERSVIHVRIKKGCQVKISNLFQNYHGPPPQHESHQPSVTSRDLLEAEQ
ncbi:MAG: hypothetical protein R6V54_00805, partial [Desulfobacteraceae bacterium]